jgi:hypothetical protein
MKVLFAIFWGASAFLAMSQLVWSLPIYEMDDHSAHGVRFSGNDQFNVVAVNNFERYVMNSYPYVPGSSDTIRYPFSNLYVYSLAVLSDNNSISYPNRCRFVQVGEDMKTQDVLLTYTIADRLADGMFKNCHRIVVEQ